MSSKQPDKYIQTLLKIKELTEKKIPTSFPNLCHELYPLKPLEIIKALQTLEDWVFINSEYGDIGHGYAGRLYFIDEIAPMEFQPNGGSIV